MRLLLTGATGFLGSNLVDLLGHCDVGTDGAGELHVAVRSPVDLGPQVTSHQLDLFDGGAVDAFMERVAPTHLCHLAWLGPEHRDRYRSPENARWVEASKRLFRAFRASGGQRLVQLGSCIEYGNARSGVRVESQVLRPDTAYGRAKAELSALTEALAVDLSTAVARPFFCYGAHEQPDRLVPSIILALDRGQPIELTEGRQRRDYLDARDVAAALLALLRSDATGPFNIGAGEAVEVRSIAERLGRIAGRPELLRFGARPEGADTAAEIVADIERLTTHTDWKPRISLERGLADTTDWWLGRSTGEVRSGEERR